MIGVLSQVRWPKLAVTGRHLRGPFTAVHFCDFLVTTLPKAQCCRKFLHSRIFVKTDRSVLGLHLQITRKFFAKFDFPMAWDMEIAT